MLRLYRLLGLGEGRGREGGDKGQGKDSSTHDALRKLSGLWINASQNVTGTIGGP